ncbi:MAG: MazG nucleotide pyrophosphohydrolase domain-containing protein, partial [Parvularcula sp.]|jgi:MazG family protein|nr:MazG nucleotide pyrophosphohydrolase domain-containing protein [Parvularcula sp.]
MKKKEREARGETSVLADVPKGLPALTRAEKISKRAARVGFEWPEAEEIIDKMEEELGELREALRSGDRTHTEEELGDVLFSAANLGRRTGIDTETAARKANMKFEKRFGHIEKRVEESGRPWDAHTLEELEAFWQEAKTL